MLQDIAWKPAAGQMCVLTLQCQGILGYSKRLLPEGISFGSLLLKYSSPSSLQRDPSGHIILAPYAPILLLEDPVHIFHNMKCNL